MTDKTSEVQLSPDSPISLNEAAAICLRGLVTAATLRAAAERGDLVIERLGRRIVTTPADIDAWRKKCRNQKAQDSTCDQKRQTQTVQYAIVRDGSSVMEGSLSPRDAALIRARKLKESFKNTSPQNIRPSEAREISHK